MTEESAVAERTFACEADELEDGDTMRVETGGAAVALYRVGDDFYATSDSCTHEKWSLGEEGDLDGFEVSCTLHNARFDVRDGKALCFPATVGLTRYETIIEDGKVYISPTGVAQ
ncbi:MAG TPA: non-heme iron oxygenase ferredoxin subunit [Amycolatopsis sp.]|uniref:non-heme iron oxygenase ferredoxin subunit n=1 Tax=unclassified Amycolatopsis TaxID=2618356 RepID=UPI00106DE4C4|nr:MULTISPECIES: non-heme iron oxygenase ferredoxin subunit [unclassified Amycolatopsis]HWD05797.1 non-heme iron oxygenase ferredoxin subunit [Amycolatopsis sp.]